MFRPGATCRAGLAPATDADTIMAPTIETIAAVARVNGVALHGPAENLAPEALRQRACTELLRQAAQREGLLAADDAPGNDGAISEAATAAIDALLELELRVPDPADEACRRHHAAHAGRYAAGERVRLRHILFAVTPGVDVVALRKRAEGTLVDVRCHDGAAGDGFAAAARTLSNCPSGAEGGDIGWVEAKDCAPEFAREIFGKAEVGVLPRLVHSRFGLHVVEVQGREPGVVPEFAAVRGAVAVALRQQGFVTALRQYLRVLAGAAIVEGVDFEGTDPPLVQ
jgi:peptidyl-prolyl cis-trans isomerase C